MTTSANNAEHSAAIAVRGARTHNLKNIDVDVPRGKLVAICGVSGSGKTSLALDTLYAEGQRRYLESFSAYTRQFLDKLDRPPVDRIEGLPPAVAITRHTAPRSSRTTVATMTDVALYLQRLLATAHEIVCPQCGSEVVRATPDSLAAAMAASSVGERLLVVVDAPLPRGVSSAEWIATWRERGIVRVALAGRTVDLAGLDADTLVDAQSLLVVVDRLRRGVPVSRLVESLESALELGEGTCRLLEESPDAATLIDDVPYRAHTVQRELVCQNCRLEIPPAEPRLFDFNSPLGACGECEGFGSVARLDESLIVPNPALSLGEGAIAPWNTPAYAHELEELKGLARDYEVPLDVPFAELNEQQRAIVWQGVPERDFGGLNGFFAWLEKRKYKMHLRVFLSRWRSYHTCEACQGSRFRPQALAYRIGQLTIADWHRLSIAAARQRIGELQVADWERAAAEPLIEQVAARLRYLSQVGVDYLTLDRPLRTLSSGESQRVSMTTSLGSTLVDMLYVVDEPTAGLHRADVAPLVGALQSLRGRGNSVLVVEHEESVIRAADIAIEFGPRAGADGGTVVFAGTPDEMASNTSSGTGDWLSGRRTVVPTSEVRKRSGVLQLLGARGHNLRGIDVEFPLGVLCVVTGVSGAGKTSLVDGTLYPAVCRQLKCESDIDALPYDNLLGGQQLEHIVRMDQSPVAKSPRSNPATYLKAFDLLRALFAELPDAQAKGFTPGHFSFNVTGGRCEACEGAGHIAVDMHFMADVMMTCQECRGERYRRDVLDVRYRGRNIAEILRMTVHEAFRFFRGENKLQARLKTLMDVGLDYLPLGQPANTLSGGEGQRLKLASYLAERQRGRTLFVFDEPAVGLHFSDIAKLIDCFHALVDVGHSMVIVEHNPQVILAADWVIDLGPGPADRGGKVVASGTPSEIAARGDSATGTVLAEYFARQADIA